MSAKKLFLFVIMLCAFQNLPGYCQDESLARRKMYLDQLLSLLPPERPNRARISLLDSTWADWLRRTGELPPDFDALPSFPFLPDPFIIDEGGKNIPVVSMAQWQEKCEWIRSQLKYWLTGTFPPAPDTLKAHVLSETKNGEVTSRMVQLSFGPVHRATLTVELLIPPGKGPFPVFLTQWNHRGWALVAVRRGYLGCIYAGADDKDDTQAYANIWYPHYDFTCLMRRAWGAHRVVDYLYTLPFVDREKIGITGHSRNSKQSLMAAAFDTRITALVASSGGTGELNPFRYTSDKYDSQTIWHINDYFPDWLHPRLRFFTGREHKLPFDQNLEAALIAPRPMMISSAVNEGNPWDLE